MQISLSNAIGGGGGAQGGGTPTPPPFSNTKSILLDGIDTYVDCGSFSAYDNGDLSVSVWVKKSSMKTYEYLVSNSGSGARAG
ncbi:MAG: hypothetical protein ACYSW3_30865, partial [Planctomycetota bacterium]